MLAGFAKAQGFETQRIPGWIPRAPRGSGVEPARTTVPELSNNDDHLPKELRSNRPHLASYEGTCKYLCLENVARPAETQCKLCPASFAVIRDQVLRFWADGVFSKSDRILD